MALTPYTAATDIIENLGTNPEDRTDLTDETFKAKFDENAKNIVEYINDTLIPAIERVNIISVTASKTLALADAFTLQNCTHASVAIVLTVPKDVFGVGEQIVVRQGGAAAVSVLAAADVTINQTELKINEQYDSAVLIQVEENVWDFIGKTKA